MQRYRWADTHRSPKEKLMPDKKHNTLSLGFPLLVKELTEQAARKRTYYVRVGYALLLFISALLVFWAGASRQVRIFGSTLGMLGRGDDIFLALVTLQFAGIYLFLPAMVCPVIAGEKERDSLSLLLLTRLGPWTIIFEKLLSRVIPMFTFLLLVLPLLAYAYTFGGVSQEQIWGAMIVLGITTVQIAAFSLMCSAYFRTTASAFVATYLIYFTVFFAIPGLIADFNHMSEEEFMYFVGPAVFYEVFDWGGGSRSIFDLALRCIPLVGSTLVFLGLTRYFLIRRAFVQPRHLLRRLFKSLWNAPVFRPSVMRVGVG
jgi:ABC-type transport system involved in multi-copper enzyme maturation permease subunit